MGLSDDDKRWFKENFGNAVIKDSRAGVPLPENGAPVRLIFGEWHMRLRNTDARTVKIAAELAALRSTIAQLQVEGAEVDYAQVQEASEAAIRNVLGSLDPVQGES